MVRIQDQGRLVNEDGDNYEPEKQNPVGSQSIENVPGYKEEDQEEGNIEPNEPCADHMVLTHKLGLIQLTAFDSETFLFEQWKGLIENHSATIQEV